MKQRTVRALGLAAAVVLLLLLSLGPAAAQCSMCRTALISSPEGQQIAAGFNNAILFLLVAPYLIFASIAAFLWKSRRRQADPAQTS